MPTKTDKKAVADETGHPAAVVAPFALFFELDNVVLHERQTRFEVVKDLLAAQKATVTPVLFSRYCLNGSLEGGLEGLCGNLGVKKFDAVQLAGEVRDQVAEKLLAAKSKTGGTFEKFLQRIADAGLTIAAVSMLQQDKAEALFDQLELARLGVKLCVYNEPDKVAPRADTWLKTAKAMAKVPRHCGAIVSSMSSCKAALSADMYCMVIPDDFTSFQDFSGCNQVLESLADLNAAELLKAMRVNVKE